MEEVDPRAWKFLIGFGAFIVIVLYLIVTQSIRRRKGLKALAAESGYDYRPEDRSLLEALDGFNVLPVGSNCRITNVLKGELGSAVLWLFDYSYHTSGKHSSYNSHSVCAIRSQDLDLPYFYLKYRVPGLDRLGSALVQKGLLPARALGGGGDAREIGIAEDDGFSRKFVLVGREPAVRPLFDLDLRQRLMRLAGTMTRVEGHKDTLLVAAPEPVLPKNARALIQEATDLFALFADRAPARR